MAKQKGLFKLEGTLDGVSFYKSGDEYVARLKGGVNGDRIKKDPKFARTRENMSEFSESAKAGKIIRRGLSSFLKKNSDRFMVARLTGVMARIKNLDAVSARGRRTVSNGIEHPQAVSLLKNFEFNSGMEVGMILQKPFGTNTDTGEISVQGLLASEHIIFPPTATHVKFQAGWYRIDFEQEATELTVSPELILGIDSAITDISLVPESIPTLSAGIDVFLLRIQFMQEVNGVQYLLYDGSNSAVSITEAI